MDHYDVIVVGAGVHGAGVAQAVSAAGYSVCVLEKHSVGSGTSSKSSKLIHGGLRYLESYQFSLVKKSLKERAVLCRLAPDLVSLQPFYIPIYKQTFRRPWKIRLGLSLYALLGNMHKNNLFKRLSKNRLTTNDGLKRESLQKIYRYYDGQTNDKKLTEAVMASAIQFGAKLVEHSDITSITKNNETFIVKYKNDGGEKTISSKVVVNAAGPWVNEINNSINIKTKLLDVDLVQGTHIIVDAEPPSGIYYLEAKDKRAIFVMPYEFNSRKRTMIGTTEKIFEGNANDVKATNEEVDYLLNVYLSYFPKTKNIKILSKFAGLRVLPKNNGSLFSRPRDTVLHWAATGLLSLYGGKLTAYRSTSDLVLKKIKPLLGKKRRITFTDQLFLSYINE